MVVKKKSRNYNPAVHVVNTPLILTKYKAQEE